MSFQIEDAFIDPATIYIVSGLPRSGTSLMMQMFERVGIEPLADGVRAADTDNPRGYYELEQVKRIAEDASFLDRARGRSLKLISRLLLQLPRSCAYRVVFMRRDLDELLASHAKMLEHRGQGQEIERDPNEMKRVIAAHLEEVEDFLRRRDDIKTLFVSYNRLLAEPEIQARRVARFLDPNYSDTPDARVGARAQAMRAAVDQALYRNREGCTYHTRDRLAPEPASLEVTRPAHPAEPAPAVISRRSSV